MLGGALFGVSLNNDSNFMQKFEAFADENAFEISLYLILFNENRTRDCNDCMPSHIRAQWKQTFDSLSKCIRIHSLRYIIHDNKHMQRHLFGSCDEYKASANFIEQNLIALIVEYVPDHALTTEICDLYQHKMDETRASFSQSVFYIFGFMEMILFVCLNVLHCAQILWPWTSYYDAITMWMAFMLLAILVVHVLYGIYVFRKRRNFCYYLQCVFPEFDEIAGRYTPYVLQPFNVCNLSDLSCNEYGPEFQLFPPNRINANLVNALCMKYWVGITYCVCLLHDFVGLVAIAMFPVIMCILCNCDTIWCKVYHLNDRLYNHLIYHDDENKSCAATASMHAAMQMLTQQRNERRCKIFLRLACYCCGFAMMALLGWPILMFTPFLFSFSVMCGVDPGTEYEYEYDGYLSAYVVRFWSALMCIKFMLGMGFIAGLECYHFYCEASLDNSQVQPPNPLRRDACDLLCYVTVMVTSMTVIVSLLCGFHSLETRVVCAFAWYVVYAWLNASALKQIVEDTHDGMQQRFFKMKSLLTFKWLFSNLLQSRIK